MKQRPTGSLLPIKVTLQENSKSIKERQVKHNSSPLLSLHPILDLSGILCVGNSKTSLKLLYKAIQVD